MPRVGFHTANGAVQGCGLGGCGDGVASIGVVSFRGRAGRDGGEQAAHVLGDDPLRLQHVDRLRHAHPQARACAGVQAGALADGGHVLAGEPAADHIDWLDLVPVDGGYVAQVRHVRPVMGEHPSRCGVELREPYGLGGEYFLDGEVEAAVAGEQRPDP